MSDWQREICCTLRSWFHEIFSQYRTVSLQMGDNCVSKFSSDSFSHTKYMSSCGKTLRTTLWYFAVFQFWGKGLKSKENYETDLFQSIESLGTKNNQDINRNLCKITQGPPPCLSWKDQHLKRRFTFDIPKFKFQNGLEQKTSNFWEFFKQTGPWETKGRPFKKMQL